jgi:hypothetical protein
MLASLNEAVVENYFYLGVQESLRTIFVKIAWRKSLEAEIELNPFEEERAKQYNKPKT